MRAFWRWCDDQCQRLDLEPRHPLAKAIAYALQRTAALEVFLADPDVPPGAGSANSARRVAAVRRRTSLQLDADVSGRSLLLVDDRTVTGWTLTIAASALREAGASAVHPLVLAVSA